MNECHHFSPRKTACHKLSLYYSCESSNTDSENSRGSFCSNFDSKEDMNCLENFLLTFSFIFLFSFFQEIASMLIAFERHSEWLSKEVRIRWGFTIKSHLYQATNDPKRNWKQKVCSVVFCAIVYSKKPLWLIQILQHTK